MVARRRSRQARSEFRCDGVLGLYGIRRRHTFRLEREIQHALEYLHRPQMAHRGIQRRRSEEYIRVRQFPRADEHHYEKFKERPRSVPLGTGVLRRMGRGDVHLERELPLRERKRLQGIRREPRRPGSHRQLSRTRFTASARTAAVQIKTTPLGKGGNLKASGSVWVPLN